MKNTVDGTTWNDSLKSAIRAFKLGDLDLAEQRLDKAFATADGDVPYLYQLAGHIAHARGAETEAEKAWHRVHELDPKNAEAWNNLGVLYRKRGDDGKALAAFQEAAAIAADRPDIHYNIGNLHKAAGRFDDAVSAYNRSIEADPSYAPAYNNLGTLYESRKERDKALEVFKRGLTADTGDASLRFNMGLVFQEEEKWDDARDAFDRALKSRPGWIPGLNNLGIVLQEMGREDDAARTFRTLLDIEPDNTSALNNLGVAYERLGRTGDARNCFRKALEEEPDYVKAALNLHDSYHDGRELNEALEEINKQITHHPRDPEIRVRMSRTLMGLTRWEEAERSLDHVLERDPEHREALRVKADLYLATRRPEDAEAILKQLPHDPEVVRDLARLNIATGRPEDAERLLSELTAVDRDDAESRRLLSGLIAESRPEEAARLRQEAADSDPGDTDDLVSMAELLGRTGKPDEALAKLDEAVNLLGSRGEAEDLDALNEVLSLHEKAAEALAAEKGDLFAERSAQLGRKLQSAIGRPHGGRRPSRSISSEIPLEQEDALSLLDLNAMEPIIRINEEEETVYLDESAEDLDDAWTELTERERRREEATTGSPQGGGDYSGPPVHIHMPTGPIPAPPAGAVPPQVIYQDIRTVPHPAPAPSPGTGQAAVPEMIVEEIVEEEVPVLTEETTEEISESEETGDESAVSEEMELDEDDLFGEGEEEEEEPPDSDPLMFEEEEEEPYFIPESDALSEDLPESGEPELPDADLVFTGENQGDIGTLEDGDEEEAFFPEGGPEDSGAAEAAESSEDEMVLEISEDDLGGTEIVEPWETGESAMLFDPMDAEEPAAPVRPPEEKEPETGTGLEKDKVADMFQYLSGLTDETTGEGRRQLIEEGVPLKLAGLYARLKGEPNLREAAHKFDRRRRERHNVELDEHKIRESLSAFRNLAESIPVDSVRESLSKKLGRIINGVGRLRGGEKPSETAEESHPDDEGAVPEELLAGLAEEVARAEDDDTDDIRAALDEFAAVLPDIKD